MPVSPPHTPTPTYLPAGLDARAASIVMRSVRAVAQSGRAVLVTIHQPSIEIFEAFDNLLLLQVGGAWGCLGMLFWAGYAVSVLVLWCLSDFVGTHTSQLCKEAPYIEWGHVPLHQSLTSPPMPCLNPPSTPTSPLLTSHLPAWWAHHLLWPPGPPVLLPHLLPHGSHCGRGALPQRRQPRHLDAGGHGWSGQHRQDTGGPGGGGGGSLMGEWLTVFLEAYANIT